MCVHLRLIHRDIYGKERDGIEGERDGIDREGEGDREGGRKRDGIKRGR